jgi:hypothetical protein
VFDFAKVDVHRAAIDDCDEMAVLNVISGDIYIESVLNNGTTSSTDTTNNWADTEIHSLKVLVSKAGAVTYKIDGVAPSTVASSASDTPVIFSMSNSIFVVAIEV